MDYNYMYLSDGILHCVSIKFLACAELYITYIIM